MNFTLITASPRLDDLAPSRRLAPDEAAGAGGTLLFVSDRYPRLSHETLRAALDAFDGTPLHSVVEARPHPLLQRRSVRLLRTETPKALRRGDRVLLRVRPPLGTTLLKIRASHPSRAFFTDWSPWTRADGGSSAFEGARRDWDLRVTRAAGRWTLDFRAAALAETYEVLLGADGDGILEPIDCAGRWYADPTFPGYVADWATGATITGRQQFPPLYEAIDAFRVWDPSRPDGRAYAVVPPAEALCLDDPLDALRIQMAS